MDFIVLSSSRGTTFQSVIDRMKDGSLAAKCLGLITDQPDRGCVEKATAAKIPVSVVEKREGDSRDDYDKRLHAVILNLTSPFNHSTIQPSIPLPQPETSFGPAQDRLHPKPVLAALGWMSILSPWFIRQWNNRIINVHPALLPKFGGAGMYGDKVHQAVLASGEQESGITIHLMDEGVDTGKILLQKTCPVLAGDTVDTLKERVQALEKEWYPEVLGMIERGGIML